MTHYSNGCRSRTVLVGLLFHGSPRTWPTVHSLLSHQHLVQCRQLFCTECHRVRSVLGPILFLLYTADVLQLVKFHQLQPHAYADDTQIYGFCKPSDVDTLHERVSVCIDEVTIMDDSNRLQLNSAKTEVLWCSLARRQHQIPTGRVRVGNTDVLPLSAVRDFGVYVYVDVFCCENFSH